MRDLRAVLVLVAVLAPAGVSAEPRPAREPGLRAAISAALAFGHAEGKAAALARYRIRYAPRSKKAADAALDEVDDRASEARDGFLVVQQFGSPFWTVAAAVRIGDAFECQAMIIRAIPIPTQLSAHAASLPPSVLSDHVAVLVGLTEPLQLQAQEQWERAARSGREAPYWAARARERLAGGPVPGC
jgi:hypothetical protein